MKPLIQLIYVSSTVGLMDEDVLIKLLVSAREANKEHGITGMLLYNDGCIMQVLEGYEDKVDQLFSNIKSDARHAGLIVLLKKPVIEREFQRWLMSYRNITDEKIDGFSEFMSNFKTNEQECALASMAKTLLHQFRG